MPEIFVSYRRSDAPGSAGRLFDRLVERFGTEQVFRDVDSIEAGENFEHAISSALEVARAVLIVIGPRWLEPREDGTRRIDEPADYVRREIERALASEAIVIPVLVEDAPLPSARSLPPTVRELTKRNAVELSNNRWNDDLRHLVEWLEKQGLTRTADREYSQRSPQPLAVLTTSVARFIPDLFALLREPRRFLSRCSMTPSAGATQAFVFFTLATLLGIAVLVSGYTPKQSVLSFALTVFVFGLFATLALSAPLWLGWRMAGARAQYRKLLAMLLHQSAVLHLAVLVAIWIVVVALDLRALDVMTETMDQAMMRGASLAAAAETLRQRLEPLAADGIVQAALALSALMLLAALAWMMWSWAAYRQTFDVSRARSAIAFMVFVSLIGSCTSLLGLLADS